MPRTDRLTEFEKTKHVKHVQGHKVKQNNSAANCSISLTFGTEFHHITGDVLQNTNVQVQRSKVKVTA